MLRPPSSNRPAVCLAIVSQSVGDLLPLGSDRRLGALVIAGRLSRRGIAYLRHKFRRDQQRLRHTDFECLARLAGGRDRVELLDGVLGRSGRLPVMINGGSYSVSFLTWPWGSARAASRTTTAPDKCPNRNADPPAASINLSDVAFAPRPGIQGGSRPGSRSRG
jgi:hypothetical protein